MGLVDDNRRSGEEEVILGPKENGRLIDKNLFEARGVHAKEKRNGAWGGKGEEGVVRCRGEEVRRESETEKVENFGGMS